MDEKFSRFERFYGRPLSRIEQNFYFVQVIMTPLQAILDIIRRDGYAILNFFLYIISVFSKNPYLRKSLLRLVRVNHSDSWLLFYLLQVCNRCSNNISSALDSKFVCINAKIIV